MSSAIALALALPLAALGGLLRPRLLAPALIAAPLPLAGLAFAGEIETRLEVVLLGLAFATDPVNRPFLLLAGLGWALAGGYVAAGVAERRRAFAACWLLTLSGQGIALLGANLASFYLGYVMMTVAAYGLVVHERSDEAWRAGRIYLGLAMAGEGMVISGLLMLGATHGNADFATLHAAPARLPALMLMVGFAVKLGAVPLHVWLPLAHPVAPVPASAVLSGVLVKAGLLGMLRFAPPEALPPSGPLLALGLLTAAYAALAGLGQSRLKTVLAYSTVSQMGIALVGLVAVASAGASAVGALALFAVHHGLNKIALFLAAGHRVRGWAAQSLFVLSAAGLAGVPFTSGALAKLGLKHELVAAPGPWLAGLGVSSVLTTVLLLHAFALARAQAKGRTRVHPAWVGAAAAGLIVPWALAAAQGLAFPVTPGAILDGVWPVAIGGLLFAVGRRGLRGRTLRVPEGDLVVVMEAIVAAAARTFSALGTAWIRWEPRGPDVGFLAPRRHRLEAELGRLPAVGLGLLLILVGLVLA